MSKAKAKEASSPEAEFSEDYEESQDSKVGQPASQEAAVKTQMPTPIEGSKRQEASFSKGQQQKAPSHVQAPQAAAQVTEITTKKVDSKEEESIDEEEMVEEEIDDDFEDGSVDEPTEAVPVESNVPVV